MNEATTKEKQNLAGLNQSRVKIEQGSDSSPDAGPATLINFAEMAIILGAAVTVDLIDVLDLTGVGAIIVRFIDIPTLGALWLWRILKTGPRKDPTFAILLAFLVEISPAGMVPTWTIFVGYVYFQDTRLGKATIGKAQKVTKIKKSKG